MASKAQIEFFAQLLNDRQVPGDATELAKKFEPLSTDMASKWIDKAMKCPKRDATEGDNTPPPF